MPFEPQRTWIQLRFNSLENTDAPDTRRSPLLQLGTGAPELAISLYKMVLSSAS
jgi:hypothetical protein